MLHRTLIAICLFATAFTAEAADVWDGPPVVFSIPSGDNTDRITGDVWITRGLNAGIYNSRIESFFRDDSPQGTRWAFEGLNGNPSGGAFSAANYAGLTFAPWLESLGGPATQLLPQRITQNAGVVHLVAEDIYLDIQFTQWAQGPDGGGALSYFRATEGEAVVTAPFPLWSTALLGVLLVLGAWRRMARSGTA